MLFLQKNYLYRKPVLIWIACMNIFYLSAWWRAVYFYHWGLLRVIPLILDLKSLGGLFELVYSQLFSNSNRFHISSS